MPTPTYTALANITLGSSASSVTFSSIPATYRDLVVVVYSTPTSGEVIFRFNSDSGSNYSTVNVGGVGSGSGFSRTFTFTSIVPSADLGSSTTAPTQINLQVFDYSATDKHKSVLNRSNVVNNGTSAQANRWASTSAINTINILTQGGSNHAAGSTFALYGVIS